MLDDAMRHERRLTGHQPKTRERIRRIERMTRDGFTPAMMAAREGCSSAYVRSLMRDPAFRHLKRCEAMARLLTDRSAQRKSPGDDALLRMISEAVLGSVLFVCATGGRDAQR